MAHEVTNPGSMRPERASLERRVMADINAHEGNPAFAAAAIVATLLQPEYRHALNELAQRLSPPTAMQTNSRGQYVPAIPLPFFGFRKKCHCGAKFWTLNRYREHYALHHILFPASVDFNPISEEGT